MFNKKVILVSGYSRGGTNILWNILQSHPLVCAPTHETGAIFRYSEHLKFSHYIRIANKLGFLHTRLSHHIIDYQLYRYKLKNLYKPDNMYKYEGKVYTKKEVADSVLCLKSVDKDIFHTDLLLEVYPNMHIVFLVRNGYAVAEGHSRRGVSIQESAKNYASIGRYMKEIITRYDRCTIIKFEDILADPFNISSNLFRFLGFKLQKLEKIRLKSKKVIQNSDKHEVSFGIKDKKYWFSRDQITQIIDPEINKKQISTLTSDQIKEYNNIAGKQLAEFGYKVIEL